MAESPKSIPSQPAERRRTARKEQKRSIESRRAILKAALSEFAAHGYEGATVRRIGERANLDFTLITYHYRTKEELWKAVVEQFAGSATILQADAEMIDSDIPPVERLKKLFRDYLNFTVEYPDFYRFMGQAKMEDAERQEWMLEKVLIPLRDHYVPLIEAAQKDGDILPGSPDMYYFLLVGMTGSWTEMQLEMSRKLTRSEGDQDPIEEFWELIDKAIFQKAPQA